jgi:UMF1 family MFS transporter
VRPAFPGLRRRLGLESPQAWAWALYDWANSVFMTTVLQLFPIYFARVVSHGQTAAAAGERYSWATAAGMLGVGLMAPLLGAAADHGRLKKPLLGAFMLLGVTCTAGLAAVGPGDWLVAVALFVLANVGASGSIVFSDSLLPHVAPRGDADRVASGGFALGYLSGGLVLLLNLAWVRSPRTFGLPDAEAALRLSFLTAAAWWLVFSLPVLRRVPEPPAALAAGELGLGHAAAALLRLRQTFRDLRRYRHLFLFLLAFLVYSDGIGTIVRMGTLYGTELGVPTGTLVGAVLLIQFLGVPCTLAFGALARRVGPKLPILVTLGVYALVTVVAYRARGTGDFLLLAVLIGTVQGGAQALSRSLFATLVPQHKSSEFFGFFGVFEKLGGVLGPALFASVIGATGSGRGAVLGLAVFFVLGGGLLARVDVAAGQAAAREAEQPAGGR